MQIFLLRRDRIEGRKNKKNRRGRRNGMDCLILVNPVAGMVRIKNELFNLMKILTDAGYAVTVKFTPPGGQTRDLVESEAPRYALIVCCGGDGTLNEVIGGLIRLEYEKRPALVYYPCGSTNDFATTLKLPRTLPGLRKSIAAGKTMDLDVGIVNGVRNFSYIASFGIFTKASYSVDSKTKNVLGHIAYLLKASEELGNLRDSYHTVIEHDGGRIEGDYIMVAVTNSTSAGGILRLSEKEVSLSDGVLELLLIKALANPSATMAVADKLIRQQYDGDSVSLIHTTHARITCDKNPPWTLDGEFGGNIAAADIRCLKGAVKLIV